MRRFERSRRTARVMFSYGFRAAPLWMTLNLLTDLIAAIIIPLQPYTYKLFTDALLDHDKSKLAIAAVLVGGAAAVQWAVRTLGGTMSSRLINQCIMFTSTKIARLVNGVPGIEHLERPEYLRELDLLRNNQTTLGQAPRQTLGALQVAVQLIGIGLLLATVSPVLVFLPVFGLAPFLAEARSVAISERSSERVAEPSRLANGLFALTSAAAPAKELRVFGLASELERRHGNLADALNAERKAAALRGFAVTAVGWLVFAAGFIAAGAYVVVLTVDGKATPGELLMTVGLCQILRVQLSQVLNSITAMLTAAKTAHRLLWLEDFAETSAQALVLAESSLVPAPDRLVSGIRLEGVSFRYPGTAVEVLSSVDLFLPAGSTVAIVGENGAGKTTLMKLLTRMYEPATGTISVDGVSLTTIPISDWRKRITAAFQDVVRYELIAGEVVGIGNLDHIDDVDALTAAVERASAGDVLAALDSGFATPVGRSFPGGRDLSGGQWQKLALARAMMRPDALVTIFDEPTASLDAHTEHALFSSYAASATRASREHGTITILTSHRFSTVGMADMIIVVEGGRIVEHGSHAELMALGGTYAELYKLQAAAYR